MPNEQRIDRLVESFQELAKVSGSKETTRVVPNNLVIESVPSDLSSDYIIVEDELGYHIPAVKTANLIVASGQFVNLLYVEGTEPIAFQQGSKGSTNVALWQFVEGTGPNIFYDNGNVSIGKITSPDATLEIVDTTSQLRLTHTDTSVFTDFTVDASHHITIDPSSTGQIKLNATITIIDEIQHEGDVDTKLGFTSDVITTTVGGIIMMRMTQTTQDLIEFGDVAGTGDVDISFNNDRIFIRGSDGNLGIQTITPGQLIDIVEDGASGVIRFTAYKAANSAISGQLNFRAARGTLASPTALLSGDRIGSFSGHGNDGFGFDAPFDVAITYNADENWDASNQGTNISFENTQLGTTSRTAQMILKSTGRLGVLTSNPLAQIHIDQSSTTAAIPVASLDQADLSEEFINFISTIGAGNPIDTAAIGTFYGKVRVAVNGTFKYMALYNS